MIEMLFGDVRPFAQCHASTLVARADGQVLVAWFGGTHEGHDDVGIWSSSRRASPCEADSRWSSPREIAKISDEPHWNPVLIPLSDDGLDLALHFKVGRSIRSWRTWAKHSQDGGETWSEGRPLETADNEGRGGRGAVRNKPIRLASGDWLAGASVERWRRWDAFFDRSPDGIGEWRATPHVDFDRRRFRGKGLIQPTLWESKPGRVHALFRSTDGFVHRSDSSDDGRTWTPSRRTTLPNNNSGIDVARLSDGTLALACNPVPGNWAERTPLAILFSNDGGESWPTRIDLEDTSGEYSYPAIVAHEDELFVSYTWNRRRIALAHMGSADWRSLDALSRDLSFDD